MSIVLASKNLVQKWQTLRKSGGYDSDFDFAEHLLLQEAIHQKFKPFAVLDPTADEKADSLAPFKSTDDSTRRKRWKTASSTIQNGLKGEVKLEVSDWEECSIKNDVRDGHDFGTFKSFKRNDVCKQKKCKKSKMFKKFPCDICLKKFSSAQMLRKHTCPASLDVNVRCDGLTDDQQPVSCKLCDKTVASERALEKHLLKAHDKKWECEVCHKKLSTKTVLDKHYRKHTGELERCTLCGKGYVDAKTLAAHMKTHTKPKDYKCDVCGKVYQSLQSIKEHQRVHTGNLFLCDTCGRGFVNPANLNIHRRTHSGEKPYGCDVCGRHFAQTSSLFYHQRVHSGEKRERKFACEFCGQAFTTKYLLTEHSNLHTGNRPYECTVCGKRFAKRRRLNDHQVVHTGARPFKCKYCSRTYTHDSSLHTHMKVHKMERLKAAESNPDILYYNGNVDDKVMVEIQK